MLGFARHRRLAIGVALIFTLSGTAFGVATDGAGAENLGFRFVTNACCQLRGTRAHIKSPAYNIHTNPTGGLSLMRVVAQGNGSLVQTGFGTSPTTSFDTCGTRSTNTVFWEYTIGGSPTCNWLGTFGSTPTNKKYAVIRTSDCTTCWYIFVDGSLQATAASDFSAAFEVYAGGEFNQIDTGTSYGCYGCDSGTTPWQRDSDVYPGTWTTIQSANTQNDDGNWSLGSPPSPFTISH
jgi:hypothetical protein